MHSIRGRLLLLAAIWISAALLAAFLFISMLLEDFVATRFDAETSAVADSLISMLDADDDEVELAEQPSDLRFSLPFSGWYWQIAEDDQIIARSYSLLDGHLDGPAGEFTGGLGYGADGSPLRVLRRQVTIPGSEAAVAITVTSPQDQIDDSLHAIIRPLAASLIILGLVLALASVAQVTIGLKSLNRLRDDLAKVRGGQADTLRDSGVSELRPLTQEINASLKQNESLLARARQHLGNLAHSLKTPLAALSNELPSDHHGQALIARMDRLISWHLRRARSAGPRTLGQRTLVRPVLDDIMLVLKWPMQDKEMAAEIDCPEIAAFAGERQDLEEMIGNLCENAVKWGQSRLRIRVDQDDSELRITIEDDGPGMSETDAPVALTRGGRLDEQGAPGFGLGLAIVADLAALHGGSLQLKRSGIGGLAAILTLPA